MEFKTFTTEHGLTAYASVEDVFDVTLADVPPDLAARARYIEVVDMKGRGKVLKNSRGALTDTTP